MQIFYDPSPLGLNYAEIEERASRLPDPITLSGRRLVVHIQTTEKAVDDLLMMIRQMAEEKRESDGNEIRTKPEGGDMKSHYPSGR